MKQRSLICTTCHSPDDGKILLPEATTQIFHENFPRNLLQSALTVEMFLENVSSMRENSLL